MDNKKLVINEINNKVITLLLANISIEIITI